MGGNVKDNLTKIKHIVREINLTMPGIIPFCPYWVDCHALDDAVSDERARGLRNNHEYFRRKIIDELWLYGDRITPGMVLEISWATVFGIPVKSMTEEIARDISETGLYKLIKSIKKEAGSK